MEVDQKVERIVEILYSCIPFQAMRNAVDEDLLIEKLVTFFREERHGLQKRAQPLQGNKGKNAHRREGAVEKRSTQGSKKT